MKILMAVEACLNERPLSQTRRETGDSKNRHSPICTRLWNSQWIVKLRHVTCVIRSGEPTAPELGTIMRSNLLQHDTPFRLHTPASHDRN